MVNRVLVVFAHPALERSRVNRHLLRAVKEASGVTLHDLYERYPDFDVEPAEEQALLSAHDVVVFQHPFFWYSVPALLKQWFDLVLEHGWAYGHGGTHLVGKWAMNAVTAGGGDRAYRADGLNGYSVRRLLAPVERTAMLCGMRYLPPFVIHGTHQLDAAAITDHACRYREILEALRDGTVDLRALAADADLELFVTGGADAR